MVGATCHARVSGILGISQVGYKVRLDPMVSLQPFGRTVRQVFRPRLVGEHTTQRFTANSARV